MTDKFKSIMEYFEEISAIPRGSGNTDGISSYLENFAIKHSLNYKRDEFNNLIITKEATRDCNLEETIMLQGHMDMVCVKKPDTEHDFLTDGIKLVYDEDYVWADGTSLGADDGIALAYMLGILSADNISHPRLECVFTTDEETGMDGALGIDISNSKAKYLINIDSEKEGEFLVGCAGGINVKSRLDIARVEAPGETYGIRLYGLRGGHSGDEIDKGRGNAIKLMGRLLYEMKQSLNGLALVSIEGGEKSNAIPRESMSTVRWQKNEKELTEFIKTRINLYKNELGADDPELQVDVQKISEDGEGKIPKKALDDESFDKVLSIVFSTPNGVQKFSSTIPGFVETSLNLGIQKIDGDISETVFSIRSSVVSQKHFMKDIVVSIIKPTGAKIEVYGDYPGWEYKEKSPLRDVMVEVWEEMFGNKPRIAAIHAGLECGIFLEKRKDLDIVSIGPDIKDIHTTEEALSISSAKRVYEYLLNLLEKISNVIKI